MGNVCVVASPLHSPRQAASDGMDVGNADGVLVGSMLGFLLGTSDGNEES